MWDNLINRVERDVDFFFFFQLNIFHQHRHHLCNTQILIGIFVTLSVLFAFLLHYFPAKKKFVFLFHESKKKKKHFERNSQFILAFLERFSNFRILFI